MSSFRKYLFPILIIVSAISISGSAAFYSVSGLSKLFAGAKLEVLIMASALEFSKLVVAALLHTYWETLNRILRVYLTTAVVILVFITSMGIYGFLSAAYQETASSYLIQKSKISFLEEKKSFFENDVLRYDQELDRISKTIQDLSSARATQIQIKDTSVVGGVRNTVSTTELRLAQQRIQAEEQNRSSIRSKREVANDSLRSAQQQILQIKNESEIASELGPLEYISNLTGVGMDQIVNILMLAIVFVFDPLAVSLVLAGSFTIKQAQGNKKEEDENIKEPLQYSPQDVAFSRYSPKKFSFVFDDKEESAVQETKEEELLEEEFLEEVTDEQIDQDEQVPITGSVDSIPEPALGPQYEQTEPQDTPYDKIVQKNPSGARVKLSDGSIIRVPKKNIDNKKNTIRYL